MGHLVSTIIAVCFILNLSWNGYTKARKNTMQERRVQEVSTTRIMVLAVLPAVFSASLVPVTFLIPLVDSTRAPHFDLMGSVSSLAYWIAGSGGEYGIIVVDLLMLIALSTRPGLPNGRRWKEAVLVLIVAGVIGGGGTALNENIIKESLKVPRPNILWLAGTDGSGPLGMTAEAFYAQGNKEVRRESLAKVLENEPKPLPLSTAIEKHWAKETGYSFPSGHSFSGFFFATFFLTLAVTYINTRRIWIFYFLLPWGLCVCYSRSILRVHTPADISVGAIQGLLLGIFAWLLVRSLIRRFI